jgi:hypothetical protein
MASQNTFTEIVGRSHFDIDVAAWMLSPADGQFFDGQPCPCSARQNKVIRRLQLGTGCQQEKAAGTCLLIWSCRDQALADRFVGSATKAKEHQD